MVIQDIDEEVSMVVVTRKAENVQQEKETTEVNGRVETMFIFLLLPPVHADDSYIKKV